MKQTTICALCACLLMTGCGGGGGSSASAPSVVPPVTSSNSNVAASAGESQNYARMLKRKAATTANSKAASTSGGVAQSTNVGFEGVTQDIVNVSVSGPANNPNYVVSYDATGNGSDEFSINTSALSATQFWSGLNTDTLGGVTATSQIGVIRWTPVDKDGNGGNDGKLYLGMETNSYDAAGDTDYTVAGYWLYAPTNFAPSDYDMGAFFDMPEEHVFKNINMTQGQASYAGDLSGFYMGDSSHPIVSDLYAGVGTIGGNVALNANFNTKKISGSITRLSTSSILSRQFYNGAIQLAETNITSQNNGAGNFFSGVASGALDNCYVITSCTNTIPQGDDYYAMSAHWGGMFYGGDGANGDQPAGVGGTISGAGIQNWQDNGQQFATYLYFVGYFGAEKASASPPTSTPTPPVVTNPPPSPPSPPSPQPVN